MTLLYLVLSPKPCLGLFEVEKLLENKHRGRPEQPCPVCNEWQSIDQLLANAPKATQPISLDYLQKEFAQVKDKLDEVKGDTERILSQIDKQFDDLIRLMLMEPKKVRAYSVSSHWTVTNSIRKLGCAKNSVWFCGANIQSCHSPCITIGT